MMMMNCGKIRIYVSAAFGVKLKVSQALTGKAQDDRGHEGCFLTWRRHTVQCMSEICLMALPMNNCARALSVL